jgi:hypothetical protein
VSTAGSSFRVSAEDLAIRVPAGTVVAMSMLDLAGAGRAAVEELSAGSWGSVSPDPGRDIAKIATIDPSGGTIRVGFAAGLGVQAGAVAVRVDTAALESGPGGAGAGTAHVVAAGTSDRECAAAATALLAEDLAALVTVGARVVARGAADTEAVLRDLGCRLGSPLAALAAVRPEDLAPASGPPVQPRPPVH